MTLDTDKLVALLGRCTTVPARVRRVVGTLVMLEVPPPWMAASVRRTERWQPPEGAEIYVAGIAEQPGIGGGPAGVKPTFRVLFGWASGVPELLVSEEATAGFFPDLFPRAPEPRPPWLEALVRHGLLADAARVPREVYGALPAAIVCKGVSLPDAIARGFVRYDWKWFNDTDDVVRDLAAIAGAHSAFRLVSLDIEAATLVFEVTIGARTHRSNVEVDGGDLSQLASRMNYWLGRLRLPRRLHGWATGDDSLVILARTPEEIEALRADVPVGDLELET